jgi:hypothetical protein
MLFGGHVGIVWYGRGMVCETGTTSAKGLLDGVANAEAKLDIDVIKTAEFQAGTDVKIDTY